ncbi:ribbon-helix-helix protein, CopG family [Persicobacter diffluens]|uniref:Ribbon-helix-helix protein, CopG family n=1 Tax=Persicobacter diffluens TaxID=981 RepID=A0AAN4W5K6_9BACT|nr:hypothetical protein PEDI_55320 [Persicobacter diffluens]
MKNEKTVRVTKGIALHEQIWEKLSQLADKEGRSRNNYMERIILEHLDTLEQKAKA